MKKIRIAVIGATGLVGKTFLQILEKNNIENFEIKLYASAKSKNKKIKILNKYYLVQTLDINSFKEVDYACFFTPEQVSKIYVPIALKHNVKVIDNSSVFRLSKEAKLVAYGANQEIIGKEDKLICNPNCSTIQSIIPIFLIKEYGIKNIFYNTYQSVSGSGKKGIDDLLRCRKGLNPIFYEADISFTCIPKIGEIIEDGFTTEEKKMMLETQKILSKDIFVSATCVRVPTMFSHGVTVSIELEKEFTLHEIIDKLKYYKNIVVLENSTPTSHYSCKNDKIYVGRLRKINNYLLFYCIADNIRVGASTNTYYILNHLIKLGGTNE